jgi:hypothetical protein
MFIYVRTRIIKVSFYRTKRYLYSRTEYEGFENATRGNVVLVFVINVTDVFLLVIDDVCVAFI